MLLQKKLKLVLRLRSDKPKQQVTRLDMKSFDQIVVVTKRTAYEKLLLRHASVTQASFALEKRGDSLEKYEREHRTYLTALAAIRASLPKQIPVDVIDQSRVPLYPWRQGQIIIVCGPDGLFVNVAKSVTDQPIITINPDPDHVTGVIMTHAPETAGLLVEKVIEEQAIITQVTLARVSTNDGQELFAVNDFLVGRLDQQAARYSIRYGPTGERQCSSGVIVSTPMGGSGWIKSCMCAVTTISGKHVNFPLFNNWSDEKLAFMVREPFASVDTGTGLLNNYIHANSADPQGSTRFTIRSEMAEGGVIFSDGMPDERIDFSTGVEAHFEVADRKINFVEK